MTTYTIFEDSSQNYYGGGQRITILIIKKILETNNNVIVFDQGFNSKFRKELNEINNSNLIVKKLFNFNLLINSENKFNLAYQCSKFLNFFLFLIPNVMIINNCLYNCVKKNERLFFLSCTTFSLLFKFFIVKKIHKSVHYAHQYISNKLIIKKIIDFLLNKFDLIICVSSFISDNYENIFSRKKKILYTPQKVINLEPKKFNKELNVFTISNIIKWKGISYLLNSHKNLKNKDKIKFHIFGKGSELDNYKKKFTNKNIIFYGFKSDSFIENFLKYQAHLSIVSSIKEEACPHLPILSFSYAIPSIVTNIGGQSSLIEDNFNGLKVDIESSESFASKIDYVFDNKKIYEKMSKNAHKTSYNFSLEKYLLNISEIFNLK